MSAVSSCLIFAIFLGFATAQQQYEWKGIFYTPDASYRWRAQKKSGSYADPTMKLAAIPASTASSDALAIASGKGTEALAQECQEVQPEGVLKVMEGKCYKLVFDQTRMETMFTVDATGVAATAFFAEHLPTEFEEDAHYFQDTTGIDIEPVAQEPDAGHAGHSHGHGDTFDGNCVCQAQSNGWKLDCNNKTAIERAVARLEANAACKSDIPKSCITDYYVMQSHHDHCLHDSLPTGIEKKLHEYEHKYTDCFVKRQFNAKLGKCPEVNCSDQTAMTQAIQLLQAGCRTAEACSDSTCASAVKIVLAAHDTCPESSLPNNLETALHDHEEPCEAQLCNTAEGAFDPYDTACTSSPTPSPSPSSSEGTDAAAHPFGGPEAFLAMALALPIFACLVPL